MAFLSPPIALIVYTYWINARRALSAGDHLFFQFEYRTTAVAMCIQFAMYLVGTVLWYVGAVNGGFVTAILIFTCMLATPSFLSVLLIPYKIQNSRLWSARAVHKN